MVKDISLSANSTGNAFCLKQVRFITLRTIVLTTVLLVFISGNIHEAISVTQLTVFIFAAIIYGFLFIYRPYSSRKRFINHTIKNLTIKDGTVLIETFGWFISKPKHYSFSFDSIAISEANYPYPDDQMVIAIEDESVKPQSLYIIEDFFTNIEQFELVIIGKIDKYLKKKGFSRVISGIDIKEVDPGEISVGGPFTSTLHIENHVENPFVIEDVITDNYLFDKKTRRFYFVRAHFVEECYFKIGYYPLEEYTAYEFNRQFKAVYLKELVETSKVGICLTMQPQHEGYDDIFDAEQEPAYEI